MKSRRRFLATSLAAGVLAVHRSTFAHGNAEHADKAASDIPKEQQEWGIAGDAKAVSRAIAIVMTDEMRFVPDRIEVRLARRSDSPTKIEAR